MLVRLLIWNVADSQTTIDELRDSLPELDPPSRWIWNEVSERVRVKAFGDERPATDGRAHDLVVWSSFIDGREQRQRLGRALLVPR